MKTKDIGISAMGLSRLVIALSIGIVLSVIRVDADLKAVFAFHERVISIVFPGFNYGIMTTVDQGSRQIAITFPMLWLTNYNEMITPHMEISLESLAADVDGLDYYQHYLFNYQEKMGTTYATVEDWKLDALSLKAYHKIYLYYQDSAMKSHKMLMITSIDDGIGIVIVVDTLAETYDTIEGIMIGILESFRFE